MANKLLPPALFSNQDKSASRDEVNQLKTQIQLLKKENNRLQSIDSSSTLAVADSKPTSSNVHVIATPVPADHRYLDELIHHQSLEIQQLKNELRQKKEKYSISLEQLTNQLATSNEVRIAEVDSLNKTVQETRSSLQEQMQLLTSEHAKTVTDLESTVEKLQCLLVSADTERETAATAHTTQIIKLKSDGEDCVKRLQLELRTKNDEFEMLTSQVTKLKEYIGSNDSTPPDISRQEIISITARLQAETEANERLRSTLDMSNVRIKSLLQIQSIQDTQICQLNDSIHCDKADKDASLLTRWREKVFALMVQQKSDEISYTNLQNTMNTKETTFATKLQAEKNESARLSHALSDLQAQLQICTNENSILKTEVATAQSVALTLDDQLTNQIETYQTLASTTQKFGDMFDQFVEKFSGIELTLKAYGQRISFASSRIDVCKAQFARKEALLRLPPEHQTKPDPDTKTTAADNKESLEKELQQVLAERDQLAAQVTDFWSTLQDRIDKATLMSQAQEKTKVEDAKREQVKAVVELRQLERRMAREAEQTAVREETSRKDHEKQIADLQQQIHRLEAEHNITMTTLRHNNLLSKTPHPDNSVTLKLLKNIDTKELMNNPDSLSGAKSPDVSGNSSHIIDESEVRASLPEDLVADLQKLSAEILHDDIDLSL